MAKKTKNRAENFSAKKRRPRLSYAMKRRKERQPDYVEGERKRVNDRHPRGGGTGKTVMTQLFERKGRGFHRSRRKGGQFFREEVR